MLTYYKVVEININELGDALESDSDIDALNVLNEFKGDIFSINYPCLWNVSETDTGLLLAKDRLRMEMITDYCRHFPQLLLC